MACSLEARVPFLDSELMLNCFSMPGALKVRGGQTKPLLKQMAAAYVPRDCVYRNKEGCSIPIKQWLGGKFKVLLNTYLEPTRLETQGLFNAKQTCRLVDEHLNNVANHSHQLWGMIVFQAWHDRWLVGDSL
jgi:asparagine synthase (glutamine-hydrolysing)